MSLRRPTVACLLFTFDISPLCGVALTPDCGIVILAFFSRGVIQTLVWHPVFLRHCISCIFLLRSHSDPRLAPSIYFWDFGRTTARLPFYLPCIVILLSECALLICSCASCLHLLCLMSKLSCEYFHSTHLAC